MKKEVQKGIENKMKKEIKEVNNEAFLHDKICIIFYFWAVVLLPT
jgi:hypothetical protein